MPGWPEKRQIIGTSVTRIDGPLKVSGKAKYSFDRNLPGLLHAKIYRSPHARARITSLDLSGAEAVSGVRVTHVIKGEGSELHYAGDEIVAVAAETEERAWDALRAIKCEFEVLQHSSSEDQSRRLGGDFVKEPSEQKSGDVEQALREAAVTVEGTYGAGVVTHVCLESHGLVAHWISDDELVVYASTQAVGSVANGLRRNFSSVPNLKVTCNTPYMGGGFGSKFSAGVEGIAAAELAKKAGRPVKLMLDRDEEHISGGNRPSAYAKVKAGADRQGKLTAFDAESWGTGGHSRGAGFPLPYIYVPTARRRRQTDLVVNAGDARAMRAPGHPQGCVVTEQVMDDLADKLGMDPVEFRLRNLPDHNKTFRTLKPIYTRELQLGAERIGWFQNRRPRGETPGPIKRGYGCALSTWGGRAGGSQATCIIYPTGQVEVRCGTQDLGVGTTTLVPLVAAEILGLQPADVTGFIGSSAYPNSGGSGGSTTCGGVSLSTALSCQKALDKLFAVVAPRLGAGADGLAAEGGRIFVKSSPEKGLTWKQSCALLGLDPVSASADKNEGAGMASQGVGGVQFADVSVDTETGEVKLNKIVAVADCGMVMNRLLCESQVIGGVIMGLNYGLFEDRRLDPATGRQLNADMEWYKLATHSDIGEIEVHLLDYPERGTIGIGEPPTIPTAAAIANAVCNAIGVRVGTIPITPRKVLEALGKV
ncbi:MAG: xanthine dehydrogenase family protein molybdopterin-binding subunit [Planctomycetota bacterium]|nr:xanthine dehydrogenase family protein molybdopterin-binding subunit [Planctomycetota bacterium]